LLSKLGAFTGETEDSTGGASWRKVLYVGNVSLFIPRGRVGTVGGKDPFPVNDLSSKP